LLAETQGAVRFAGAAGLLQSAGHAKPIAFDIGLVSRMTNMRASNVLALFFLAAAIQQARGGDGPAPSCSPERAGYCECVTHSCQLVPEVKQIKKVVYEVREVPYCLKKLPPLCSLFGRRCCQECGECAECDCPRYKKVLVKKEIVCGEICTSKCVVREHVERTPCRVCTPSCGAK
jgi:hypothetical protein